MLFKFESATFKCHIGFVEINLVAEHALALRSSNVWLEFDAKLYWRARLMMVAQMQRAEGIEGARQLPLLAKIAPTKCVHGHAAIGHTAAVLEQELRAQIQILWHTMQILRDHDSFQIIKKYFFSNISSIERKFKFTCILNNVIVDRG